MTWIRTNSDKLLLVCFLILLLFIGVRRLDFAGDGLRHLEHILQSNRPVLGEPRWLLFPALLFAVLKPFETVGLIHSVAQAARVFCVFNIMCGFVYLVCLRRWLTELSPVRRAAVLLLAGGSYVFLTLATDTIEPTAGVLIAIAGITFARYRSGLSDMFRITIAAASLALAGAVYQGLLFGFFFLPAIFPFSLLLTRQAIFRIVALAMAVPLLSILLLTAGGDTPRNAARRFLKGESNSAASSQYSKVSAKNVAGVMIVGPAYAFASIPELRGLTGSLRLVRNRKTAFEGIRGVAAWCCIAGAIAVAVVLLILKKEFALLLAFAGMMALPAIRISQYSYMKYYVLLPFLVALVVPRLGVRFVFPAFLGALLLLSNFGDMWTQRAESATLRSQVARDLYPKTSPTACFLTNGWGPPVPEWRGDSLAWSHILYGGNAESLEKIAEANSAILHERLKQIFCRCPMVVTDAFIQPNQESLQRELSDFHITSVPISKLLVLSPESAEIFRSPKFVVYRFSVVDQQRACQAME
jgi:hypothetical protein